MIFYFLSFTIFFYFIICMRFKFFQIISIKMFNNFCIIIKSKSVILLLLFILICLLQQKFNFFSNISYIKNILTFHFSLLLMITSITTFFTFYVKLSIKTIQKKFGWKKWWIFIVWQNCNLGKKLFFVMIWKETIIL